ncbi:alpha/beta fold hydrolase [Streptomyces sp. NPDC003717]|uniref:thioesterase II family protein n=1 Tax=Streptomyces sp. NPDC003717 TaxID=3154276 RepID=UPI0033BD444C
MTTDVKRGGRVLVRRHPRPDATGEVLCFAHAGGSPGEYARWSDELPDAVRLSAVQLPGRGARAAEPPATTVEEIAEEIATTARPTVPFVLFGHSFGGLLALAVARTLRARGGPAPERLVVSASPAPPLPRAATPLHTLPDDAFLAEVERRWGRLPDPVRERPELLERAVAAFRADVTAFETYRCPPGDPLDCPVTAFVGDEEEDALPPGRWAATTRGPLTVRVLPGGHFYLRGETQRAAILAEFRAALHHPTTTDPGAPEAPAATTGRHQ